MCYLKLNDLERKKSVKLVEINRGKNEVKYKKVKIKI